MSDTIGEKYVSNQQYYEINLKISISVKQIKTMRTTYAKNKAMCNDVILMQNLREEISEVLVQIGPIYHEYEDEISIDAYQNLLSISDKLEVFRRKMNHLIHKCFRNCDINLSLYPKLESNEVSQNKNLIDPDMGQKLHTNEATRKIHVSHTKLYPDISSYFWMLLKFNVK